MKKVFSLIFLVAPFSVLKAQRDTTKKTVVITSAYKPVLKPAAKINFSAATPGGDSLKPTLVYNVPAQNLFFSYQPASLKPLALSPDSSFQWTNDNFVKLGVGNYKTPFAQAGLSFGDGKKSIVNLHAKHISQKGNLPFQQYSQTGGDVTAMYSTDNNLEWRGRLGMQTNTQYYYGYNPDTLKYSKDSLRQRFGNLNVMVGLRNKNVNSYGITYDPTVSVNFFRDNRNGKETNLLLNAPLTKTLTNDVNFNVAVNADLTHFSTYNSPDAITNNLYFISPAFSFKKSTFSLNAGVTPSWDNSNFHLLPNFTTQVKVKDENFVVLAGWVGYYQKNTYQSLTAFNPWISQPAALVNTRMTESYFGFKGSATSHFTYNARLSIINYKNAALFLNDNIDGKTFQTLYEPKMRALKIHGEVGYTVQEKFSLLAGASINKFSAFEVNKKAWGLLPLEANGSLRWQVLKDLQFKSDLFMWNGALYQNKEGEAKRLKGAFDLNAGVEFAILPKLNLWLQFNNVLNNKYQRWNQYEVLGFNVMGGIVYSFSKAGL